MALKAIANIALKWKCEYSENLGNNQFSKALREGREMNVKTKSVIYQLEIGI